MFHLWLLERMRNGSSSFPVINLVYITRSWESIVNASLSYEKQPNFTDVSFDIPKAIASVNIKPWQLIYSAGGREMMKQNLNSHLHLLQQDCSFDFWLDTIKFKARIPLYHGHSWSNKLGVWNVYFTSPDTSHCKYMHRSYLTISKLHQQRITIIFHYCQLENTLRPLDLETRTQPQNHPYTRLSPDCRSCAERTSCHRKSFRGGRTTTCRRLETRARQTSWRMFGKSLALDASDTPEVLHETILIQFCLYEDS